MICFRWITIFLLALILVDYSADSCAAQESSEGARLRERFEKESPSAWAVLEAWDRDIELSGELTVGHGPTGSVLLHYCRNGDLTLAEESSLSKAKPQASGLFASNGRYGFWVQRKAPETPWVLQYLYQGAEANGALDEIESRYVGYINSYCRLGKVRFSDLSKEDGFSWTAFQTVQKDGKEYVQVSYRKLNQYRRETAPTPVEGHMTFDPSNSWACVEHFARLLQKVRFAASDSDTVRITYADDPVGPVRPFSRVEMVALSEGKPGHKTVFSVNKIGRATAPEAAFTLTGYGLPEIAENSGPKRSYSWLWLGGAGLLCGIGAVLVRFRRRRAVR